MKIGLISDTHSYLDDSVFKYFENCDEIWHAGDFGSLDVIEKLRTFKPLRGVYGNIDDKSIQIQYPENLRFKCEDVDVWITHIGGYPNKYSPLVKPEIINNPPKLFITGHSHILKVQYDQKLQLLHINPGAAGKQGWQKVRTIMRFEINSDKIENLEVIELHPR
ncbi:metallophosphoesterase family protein [Sphingobacterium endophyticum]|uniref:metallophosphoesterase family protein n=1 Tax=Sphingobacterium endophyticum TaxID=2546448 RepID=UPI0012E2F7E6|nr:metallophosphoesterase family protein [Sphingobacterium endophyticum]